jgi:hypothetical protein
MAGSTGEPDTLESVCRAAITAQCQRHVECGNSVSLLCFGYADLCPEYYFGPGSTRTLESVRACIPAIRQMSCSDLAVDALPGCLIGGERASGMGCAYGSQCASLTCESGTQQCGKCSSPGKVGDSCAIGWCETGAFCNHRRNCEALTSIVHGTEGATCDESASPVLGCGGDLICWAASGTTPRTCTRLVSEGNACTGLGGLPCAAGLVCVRNADGGGTCSSLTSCGAATCDANSYCKYNMTPATCAPRALEGKPCMMSQDTGQVPCIAGTTCTPVTTAGPQGICLKPGNARAAVCSDTMPCTAPLQCLSGHCAALDPATCGI